MVKEVLICPKCQQPFPNYNKKLRRFCSKRCRNEDRAETLALCRKWLIKGWSYDKIKKTFHVGHQEFSKIRKKLGFAPYEGMHCSIPKIWSDELCREIIGDVNKRALACSGKKRPPIYAQIAKEFGVTEATLKNRLWRYRLKCRKAGIDPNPELQLEPEPKPVKYYPKGWRWSVWSDEELKNAFDLVNHIGYSAAAQRLDVDRVILIGRIDRYLKRMGIRQRTKRNKRIEKRMAA